ncbi:MAG: 6-phosphogluconolactonase [Rhizobiaceae bacterium]
MSGAVWHEFASGEILARELAANIADDLRGAITVQGGATLAVSGGTTPGRFFDALSAKPLDWPRVTVTLIDERDVPPVSDRSNEKLVRSRLLRGEAANAKFVGLRGGPDGSLPDAENPAARDLKLPFDVAVLGMGLDGHTASLFPDADGLQRLLDPKTYPGVYVVLASSAGETRLSWPLAAIVAAGQLYLHIEGDAKRKVAEDALSHGSELVIGRVLAATSKPSHIYWAP